MLYVRLAARAVRWRAGASVAIFLVATAAVLAAALGPVYSAAAGASVLKDRLQQTPETRRDVLVTAQYAPLPGRDSDPGSTVLDVANMAAKTTWFGAPTMLHSSTINLKTPGVGSATGRIAALQSACQHLVITQGHCPTGPLDALLSTRSASVAGLHVGDRVGVFTDTTVGSPRLVLRLVGLYRVPSTSGFWAPWGLFDAHTGGVNTPPQIDSFLLRPGVITDAKNRPISPGQVVVANVPLLVDRVHPGDESALRSLLSRISDAAQKTAASLTPVSAGVPLAGVLTTIDHEKNVGGTLIALATEQLAALAIIVLGGIVATTAGARSGEVALAKLRGKRTAGVAGQALFEPVSLIVLAAPVGAALAWVVVSATAGGVLTSGTPVGFPVTGYAWAVGATAAAIVVAALAARRMLAAPVADLLRRGTDASTERSAGALIADVAVVALAIAGLVQLSVGGVLDSGRPNPLAALAPTLLAAGVAVLGLRLLPYVLRLVIRRTGRRRGMVGYLAVRQIGRRPRSTRMALLVAVATALAILAVATWSMAARNREYRALNQVGAHSVLTVTPKPGVDLVTAVRRADPSGTQAMAVEYLPVSNTQLLAVDTSRLATVAAWRPDYAHRSVAEIAKLLAPPLPQPVVLRGTELTAQLELTRPGNGAVDLTFGLSRADHFAETVTLGPIRPGRTTYRAALPFGCTAGCRVTGLILQRAPGSGGGAMQLHVGGMTTDGRSDGIDRLLQPRFWQSADNSGLTASGDLDLVSPAPDGNGSWGQLATADLPAALPGAVAPVTASVYPGPAVHSISSTNVDAAQVTVDGVVLARVLPKLDRAGVLVDLTLAERAMTGQESTGVQHQVWLSASAAGDIVARLQAQGLHVTSRTDASTVRDQLDRTGPALADVAFLIAAIAAAALAVAAAVLGGLLTARRRAYEVAALLAVGLRARTLRRATAVENGLVVGIGLLLGAAAGVGGSVLALRSTPVFVDTNTGPPVEPALPVLPVVVVLVVLVVALAVTCALLALGIVRLATPDRLREAAP